MAGLRKILITLLVLVLILLALVFSLNNQMAVSLNFLLFETQPHGVAVWIIMAFVIGALVGVLVTTMLPSGRLYRAVICRSVLSGQSTHSKNPGHKTTGHFDGHAVSVAASDGGRCRWLGCRSIRKPLWPRLPSHYGRGFRSGPSAVSLYQLL